MCSVDKRLLAEALKLKAEKPILLDFGFGADGQDKSILDSFQLTGDKTISVPVSLTVIYFSQILNSFKKLSIISSNLRTSNS